MSSISDIHDKKMLVAQVLRPDFWHYEGSALEVLAGRGFNCHNTLLICHSLALFVINLLQDVQETLHSNNCRLKLPFAFGLNEQHRKALPSQHCSSQARNRKLAQGQCIQYHRSPMQIGTLLEKLLLATS